MSIGEDRGCQELIEQLNESLAGEYRVIAGYATVIALLRAEVTDRQGHARVLADSVTALGGQPTTAPPPMLISRDPRELLEQLSSLESRPLVTCRKLTPHLLLREENALLNRVMELATGETAPLHAAPRASAPN